MSNELTVVEQREVPFYDDRITAVLTTDGTVYVPIRPICDLLGIAWTAQRLRINRDPILAEFLTPVIVTITGHAHGKTQDVTTLCLPLDYLNGWLFGINANRVKSTVRESLLRYQRECYRVLADAFTRNQITHQTDESFEALLASDDPTAVAYRHAMAIANIAREQLMLKAQFDSRMRSAEDTLVDHDNRLDLIEAELGNPDRFITVSQAEQLSQAVRAVGLVFSQMSGRNEYGGVYGELHRRFSINSYKRLPAAKFEDAMSWLRQWHEELTDGDDAPF